MLSSVVCDHLLSTLDVILDVLVINLVLYLNFSVYCAMHHWSPCCMWRVGSAIGIGIGW